MSCFFQIIAFCLILSVPCHAADKGKYQAEVQEIPTLPSIPANPLLQIRPKKVPHCERYFIYEGKKMECDSDVKKDAERLRVMVHDVPSAVSELNIYQKNQNSLRIAAYAETAGFVIGLTGLIISRTSNPSSNSSSQAHECTFESDHKFLQTT